MKKNYKKAEVLSVSYHLLRGQLMLSLQGYPHTLFVNTEEINFAEHEEAFAGQQSPSILRAGSIIKFLYDSTEAVRDITDVTLMSDGITEIDDDGKFIKW